MQRARTASGCSRFGPLSTTLIHKGLTTTLRQKDPTLADNFVDQLYHRRIPADTHYRLSEKINNSLGEVRKIQGTYLEKPTLRDESSSYVTPETATPLKTSTPTATPTQTPAPPGRCFSFSSTTAIVGEE